MSNYCECRIPRRITKYPGKGWICTTCRQPIAPDSPELMTSVPIKALNLISPSANEILIQNKINEMINRLKVGGLM